VQPQTWRECSIGAVRRSLLVLLACLVWPAAAAAAPVAVLGRDGHVAMRIDPFVTGPAVTPPPALTFTTRRRRTRRAPAVTVTVTVPSVLAGLARRGAITPAQQGQALGAWRGALGAERRLRGAPRAELSAVTATMHDIATAHALTPSRLPEMEATLDANVRWWTAAVGVPLPYQRIEFAGSELVWEYYPGQGIQLQVLGSFGKADGLYTSGPAGYPAMEQLLAEIIPLAAQRAGGLAWEYDFPFDGGEPPWTSAMSQATGLQALSDAFTATRSPYYVQVGTQALSLFQRRPPAGVAVAAPFGTRFLQYTFAPGTDIINAFLQTLIGLHAFASATGNATATRLFAAGNAEAVAEVPRFDTGAWSLYQPGLEDDLSYHQLVTGFLSQLCSMTGTLVYCTTAQHFQADLTTPPALTQLTQRALAGRPLSLRFRLSKIAHVGIVVVGPAGHPVLVTSASFPYGVNSFSVPVQRRPGTYGVTLTATDLAGNYTRVTGSMVLTPAPPPPPRRRPHAARGRRRSA
jgi:hypothetical protein